MIGRDRGGDDLEWALGASLRMACKGCRANGLRRRMRGPLGPRGAAERPPWAAVLAAFDTLAVQVPEDATWAVVGRPRAARAQGNNLPWTALNEGVETDPWPSSGDRQVVPGKQGK